MLATLTRLGNKVFTERIRGFSIEAVDRGNKQVIITLRLEAKKEQNNNKTWTTF
ncbi:hypothetical protein R3W88_000682 [Solanum pinnatisectum]|uniref:Uncharacterized protein n=1 Tax=Solanum pinnatisectum TaxID=50273 RepID=A0AAV9MJD0_9SOLN|nr:hypothetical protein R3W88_000682 [Solanum pinnatisectum]